MRTEKERVMEKKNVKKTACKAVKSTGTVVRKGLGFGLILLNAAATAVGAIVCAVTSQD